MTKTKILQKEAPVLREIAKKVDLKDIESKKIKDVLTRMKEALYAEDDGVAIAAPQIGESLRIFMVREDVLTFIKKGGNFEPETRPKTSKPTKDLVFINPEIVKISKEKEDMEEGCLSVRWLYGYVKRSKKVTIKGYNEKGGKVERGATALLAQIFQHEIDHLDGVLFIDKASDVQDLPPPQKTTARKNQPKMPVKFVYFGSSQFSSYVLEELEKLGFAPLLTITSAKKPLPIDKLKKLQADLFIVASFGKILPKEVLDLPKYKTLNVHPSLLPKLRGASPIQNTILGQSRPGITIIRIDEKMDHGPILVQGEVSIEPWPDHYLVVEEKLGRIGGQILGAILPKWLSGEIEEIEQDDSRATYTKEIKKEEGLLDLNDSAEKNLRKVLAFSRWPGAHIIFKNKFGKDVRIVIKDAKITKGKFEPTRVIPAGKKEMDWQDFLRGN